MNFEWKDVREQHLRENVCLYKRGKEAERLGMNYSALLELYSDLQNFRLPSEEDKEPNNSPFTIHKAI